MAVTSDKPAPYAPAKAILDIVDRFRHRGLPAPVNSDVLGRAGIPGSLIPRTLQALQTLDLIDETGKPTPTFETIRLAPEAEFKKRLEDWLKGAYADVFAFVDPSKDDEIRIRDAFRSYQPIGQQSRMVSLFQGLCGAAGLLPEKAQQPRPSVTRPRPASAPISKRAPMQAKSAQKPPPGAGMSSTVLPPALAGLLASLPPQEVGWTQTERDKFMNTFGAVLDYCIPLVENGPDYNQQEDEQ